MAVNTCSVMMTVIMKPNLGIDIGRVIIHGDGPDTSFIGATDEDSLKAPPMEGIVPHRFLFGASHATDPSVYPVPTWTAAEAGIRATRDEWEALDPSARLHSGSGRTSSHRDTDPPLARR